MTQTYEIIAGSRQEVETIVNSALERGWMLQGGVALSYATLGPLVYAQALVVTTDEREEVMP